MVVGASCRGPRFRSYCVGGCGGWVRCEVRVKVKKMMGGGFGGGNGRDGGPLGCRGGVAKYCDTTK